MGAEATITLKRIIAGHHLLQPHHPVFTVEEGKAAIIPAHRQKFGWWTSLEVYGPYHPLVESHACVVLFDDVEKEVIAGLVIVKLNFFLWCFPEWREQPPGAANPNELLKVWNRIGPGVWAVTGYFEYGVEHPKNFQWQLDGLTFGTTVEYEIWT